MQLPNLSFVVLDTETTGFIPKINRIIEYADVVVRDGKISDEYEVLVSIPTDIPAHVVALTRIEEDDLEGKAPFEDMREEIESRLQDDIIIVGQNVGFDIRMLKGEGIDLTNKPWVDTSMLASLIFPELESYSLGFISQALKLNHEPVHRALGDVHATLELLGKCWERLLELPTEEHSRFTEVMCKSSEGYKRLAEVLPEPTKKDRPVWMHMPIRHAVAHEGEENALSVPGSGDVQLAEEPLAPGFVQRILNTLESDSRKRHWIAVKNLYAARRHIQPNANTRILSAPYSLLNPEAAEELLAQTMFTADEATLAVKLHWYNPKTFNDLPIHGDEKHIWGGKLSCTVRSPIYVDQFEDLPNTILLDHQQLLTMLVDEDHPGNIHMSEDAHIVIDDASMLEDTATKAYGWYCPISDIRAAAEAKPELTKFVDLLQLWIEKTRELHDVHYLTSANLKTPDASGLRDQLSAILDSDKVEQGSLVESRLTDVLHVLDPEKLSGRISFIEQRQDGSQFIQSVPEHIGEILNENLYQKCGTTLLIPPGSAETLREVIPKNVQTHVAETFAPTDLQIHFSPASKVSEFIENPEEGKTIILVGSRGRIEDLYVKYAVHAEEQGITLLCQGLSGGMGRMQAEFMNAKGTTLWIITPWVFEGIDIEPETIHHLVIDTLPFDHPAHTVISKRAEHYQNAFMDYSLRRLEHRIFRLLRTFCRYRAENGAVHILDDRIEKKRYGKEVWNNITGLLTPEKTRLKDADEDQLPLF